ARDSDGTRDNRQSPLSGDSDEAKADDDKNILIDLCKKVIYHNPTKNCIIKSPRSKWNGLPKSKSLFHTTKNRGLPIGNFTSQVFANFYLNSFDHFIKHKLGIRYYGRYVDDFVVLHKDKKYLKNIIPVLRNFLWEKLRLTLHPKKIYLQHYSKGVAFLGVFIRPYRTVAGKRMAGNFYWNIEKWNQLILENVKTRPIKNLLSQFQQKKFLSSMNSYLGIMKHYNSYKLRKKMLTQSLSVYFWNHVYIFDYYNKLVLRK
ncbi:RNA-directed DNA polymerase, partial [Candidatus Parcubacteria bacterium]|nr:RNA-directed DNA polymerase [Candidatus Parcubacteria bacterium]